jgi:hypothetical protein
MYDVALWLALLAGYVFYTFSNFTEDVVCRQWRMGRFWKVNAQV